MRPQFGVVCLTIALVACAQPSATPGPRSAPAPGGAANPCAVAGTCTVDIVLQDDVVALLQRSGMGFKVFDGCPRTLGFRDNSTGSSPMLNDAGLSVRTNTSMRGAIAVAQSINPTIVLPKLTGRYATVGIFFRADPGKYAVVDFSNGTEQSVKFGYMYNGRAIVDDNIVDGQNRTAERHLCP